MQVERDAITPAYVEEMLDEVARRTGYRMANDRFGFVPALLAIDRERAASARPATPGDGAAGLEQAEDDRFAREFREAQRIAGVHGSMEPYARVLSGRLRQMDKRAKAANLALSDLREQTKLDIGLARAKVEDAQQRATAAEARFKRLLIAFHDATRRPLGVTPASGDEFYDWRLAEAAEERRPLIGTEKERQERPEAKLVRTERAIDEALRIGAEQAKRLAALAAGSADGGER